MQAQASAGGGSLQDLLQNPKVQIGVIAFGAIALIVVVYLLFFSGPGTDQTTVPTGNMPGAAAGIVDDSTPPGALAPGAAPGAAGAPPGMPGMPMAMGTPGVPGGAPAGAP